MCDIKQLDTVKCARKTAVYRVYKAKRVKKVRFTSKPEQLTLERLQEEFVVGLDLLHLGSLDWRHHNTGRYVRSSICSFTRAVGVKTISTGAVLLWSHPRIAFAVEWDVWNGSPEDSAESWAQTKGEQPPRPVRPLNKVTVNIHEPADQFVLQTGWNSRQHKCTRRKTSQQRRLISVKKKERFANSYRIIIWIPRDSERRLTLQHRHQPQQKLSMLKDELSVHYCVAKGISPLFTC